VIRGAHMCPVCAGGRKHPRVSNPVRVYFPARGETKLDLDRYYRKKTASTRSDRRSWARP